MKPFAFVFPGQGSQSVGMLDGWGDNAAVRQTLEEASAALGEDIGLLIHEGPKGRLDLTANTQPAMLAAGVACYRAWLAETKLAPEKLIATVDRHGNTSAASIPLALDEAVRSGTIKRGDTVMLEGVGGGFTWGAALLDF